jgi:glycerol-3-phosphate dehydrogenase (NAD(P)+)
MKLLSLKNNPMNIAVIGSGSWGTALAVLLSRNGHIVRLWGHNKEHVQTICKERENSKYLPQIKFNNNIKPLFDIKETVEGSHIVVMAVPSHALREVFKKVRIYLGESAHIISATKGIENKSLLTMTQVISSVLLENCLSESKFEVGVLSGPSFAKEVANCQPTAVTIGFRNLSDAIQMQGVFANEYFRVYASKDVIGLEISASFKNVIAIASGVCEGLGYGYNTRAALITRGLAEMRRLGVQMHVDDATFSGLSGLGDLVLTCTGDLSRNRMVGLKLGRGQRLSDIMNEMSMVAEGIKTTEAVHDLAAKLQIEMPITEQVYQILYKGKSCSMAVRDLLIRVQKIE